MSGMIAVARNNSNNKIQLRRRLVKIETGFHAFGSRLKVIKEGYTTLNDKNKRETREMINQTFNAMRDATLDIFDSFRSNGSDDGEQNESPPLASDDAGPILPIETNTTNSDISVNRRSNDHLAQMSAYTSGCRRNSKMSSDAIPRSAESVISSFDSLSLSDSSTAGPITRSYDESIPVVETSPTAGEPSLLDSILAMLERMGQTLLGFFQWLLKKISKVAVQVWNTVCDAFTYMFSFLSDCWNKITG